jgi:poly(3-hydroxybutyrate) depolymerase
MVSVRITALLILALSVLSGCASLIDHETLRFKGFETTPRHFTGILTLPKENKEPVPVMVLVHGSAGVDSTPLKKPIIEKLNTLIVLGFFHLITMIAAM